MPSFDPAPPGHVADFRQKRAIPILFPFSSGIAGNWTLMAPPCHEKSSFPMPSPAITEAETTMSKAPKPVRKAVFPVAGMGTRFLPATKAMPKEMLPVVDKPVIQYAVEEAREAGIEQFVFITG